MYRALQRARCKDNPHLFIHHVRCVDAKSGDEFEFQLLTPEEAEEFGVEHRGDGWFWQREILDWWIDGKRCLVLKARQLGVTWLSAAYALWHLVFLPGTNVLIFSIGEEEAADVIRRIWTMFRSLPDWLTEHLEILYPKGAGLPSEKIVVRHMNGRESIIQAMPATKKAGHSKTAALVILDEASRQDYAADIYKAVIPVMADGGRLIGISTANGMSGGEAGKGNFFHYWWMNAEAMRTSKRFLRWDLHPDRDERWYREEAESLPTKDRAEQYPNDEDEAFILTGTPYFDRPGLAWYRKNATLDPIARGVFVEVVTPYEFRKAYFKQVHGELDEAWVNVYREPRAGGAYAIGVDAATGYGDDYTSGDVIDLHTQEIVATFHGKIDSDIAAQQLHYLGKWYNNARIAVERGGGYGDIIITSLRDGKEGRPPYPSMYIHRDWISRKRGEQASYGFPITGASRGTLAQGVEKAIRRHDLPGLPRSHFQELITFVHAASKPTPRAQDGCNDDRVMSLALALEMFRQYGRKQSKPPTASEEKRREEVKQQRRTWFPWQEED